MMAEDKSSKNNQDVKNIPLLTLRDIVIFPHMTVPLLFGRDKSIRALEEAIKKDREIFLVAQKDPAIDDPNMDEVYHIGIVVHITPLLKLPDGTLKVLVEGKSRGEIIQSIDSEDYPMVEIKLLDDIEDKDADKVSEDLKKHFETYIYLDLGMNTSLTPTAFIRNIQNIENYGTLADAIASHLAQDVPYTQKVLETLHITERMRIVLAKVEEDINDFRYW